MDIRGKKFIVIGGGGLIGSHTVDRICKEDVKEIIIYDNFCRGSIENLSRSIKDSRVKIYDVGGDILQTDILNNAISGADGVFHFAALWLLQCHEFPQSAFDVNIRGTFNVMQACVKNNIQKLIFSSSASVYGDALQNPMTEEHPYNNKNFYGATKIACEAMLHSYYHRYNLNYVGLRYMNVYGPRQDYHGAYIAVIMKMLDAIDRGDSPTIIGDGSEEFDFISVEDCAEANICAIKSDTTDENYNVCTGIKTSLKELARKIIEITGCHKEIQYKPSKEKTFVSCRVGDPEKALNELKFKAKIRLREGLIKLINWRDEHKKYKNTIYNN